MVTAWQKIFGIDSRALKHFRIAISVVYIVDFIIRMTSLTSHYSDDGVLPRSALYFIYPSASSLSLNMLSGSTFWQFALFVLAIFSGLCVLFNVGTRFFILLSWVLLVSVQNRNPLVFHLGDSLSHLLFFWAIFLPWDQKKQNVVSAATVGIILQIFSLYFFSYFEKTGAPWRVNNLAVYSTLQIDQFVTPLGTRIGGLPVWFLQWATRWILWVELLASVSLLMPWSLIRTLAAIHLIMMHAGFLLTVHLGTFPWVDLASLIIFLPKGFWDWWDLRLIALHGVMNQMSFIRKIRMKLICFQCWRKSLKWESLKLNSLNQTLQMRYSRPAKYWTNGVVGTLVAYVLVWNIFNIESWRSVTSSHDIWFSKLRNIGLVLQLNQRWDMFSPFPLIDDGYFDFEGINVFDSKVDAWIRPGTGKLWKSGQFTTEFYPDERWRRAVGALYFNQHAGARPWFARYLCREWNLNHRDKIESLAIYFNLERTEVPPLPPVTDRILLWQGHC